MNNINKVNRCPICNSSVDPTSVVSINDYSKTSYLKYSEKKYNGLLDDWLDILHLEIYYCSECSHYWYSEQPSQTMLNNMYDKGQFLRPQNNANNKEPTLKMIREMERLKKVLNFKFLQGFN